MARKYSRNNSRSMQHLNGNLLCCIDTETTGLISGTHDIWQIAVLPLDENIQPLKGVFPFYMDIKIKDPSVVTKKAIQMNYGDWLDRQKLAIDPFMAADLFDEWFQKLGLPMYKKIVPLAQNFPFDRAFIMEWLGWETFDQLFHPHYRDLMTAALFVNDCTNFKSERIKYPKVNLAYLSNVLETKNLKAHDALQDCITTAECYRRLIMRTI